MQEYKTGAKRAQRMPRYDLIPKIFIDRLALRFTGDLVDGIPNGGALKYGESNWERGLPTSDVINHIINHLTSYQDRFRQSLSLAIQTNSNTVMLSVQNLMQAHSEEDDDLAAAAWGIAVLMYQEGTGMFHDDQFPLEARETVEQFIEVGTIKSITLGSKVYNFNPPIVFKAGDNINQLIEDRIKEPSPEIGMGVDPSVNQVRSQEQNVNPPYRYSPSLSVKHQ